MAVGKYYFVGPFGGYEASIPGVDYTSLWAAPTTSWLTYLVAARSQNDYDKPRNQFAITRGLMTVSLVGLPNETIYDARIIAPQTWLWATHRAISGILVDGRGVYGNENGYGILRERTDALGGVSAPGVPASGYHWVDITLNQAGRDLVYAYRGQNLTFGLRIDQEISGSAPGGPDKTLNERQDVNPGRRDTAFPDLRMYLRVVYGEPEVPGYIWVEGTKLAYLDLFRWKRIKEGILDGSTGEPGHLWPEGDNLRYIDEVGDERYIAGTPAGVYGTGGYPWVEGPNLCYTDASGVKRCFVGDLSA